MFTESAELYDALYSFKDYAAEAARIAAIIRSERPGARTVLDVACGSGEHARRLFQDCGFEVDGLDLDPGLLRLAREKHPTGAFFLADMSDFTLNRRYDALLCLFGSIGYLVTLERVRRAIECFSRHLVEGGVLLVEPWFPPGVLEDGRELCLKGAYQGREIERLSRCEIDGRISRLHFRYRIDTGSGMREASETHELGLFTREELSAEFRKAGLRSRFDPVGLDGRGLWVLRTA